MPLPPPTPELAAYLLAASEIRDRLLAYALAAWAATSIDDRGAAELAARLVPMIAAGQIQIATLTAAYLGQQLGSAPARMPEELVTALRGVDPELVYQRPVIATRSELKHKVVDLDEAREVGARRLESLLTTDLQMAKVHQGRATLLESERKYYRRVPRAEGACALCLIASTMRYKVHALMPIHPGCQCGIDELPAGMNLDDNVIDVDLLNATHAKVKEFTGIADRGGRAPDYRKLIITRKHGELGDVLAYRGYQFTNQDDVQRARESGESRTARRGGGRVDRPEPAAGGSGGRPPTNPPTGGQSVSGGEAPREYPPVGGDGGQVPFTPANPPTVTDKILDHIMVGEPRRSGWYGGHGPGAGRGKSEFPAGWDRDRVREAVEQLLVAPESIERTGSTLVFRGTIDGVPIVALARGRVGPPLLWTAYPEQD